MKTIHTEVKSHFREGHENPPDEGCELVGVEKVLHGRTTM
jgi:hypothetical protein